jgi:type I restriction-modification system DNA methylase subunit
MGMGEGAAKVERARSRYAAKGRVRGGPRNHADFIWSVADLLRGDYKQSEYGKVILPLTVLRQLDGVLAPTKQQVLEKHRQSERPDVDLDGDGRGDLAVNPLKS